MRKRIIYTRRNGSVAVCAPSHWCLGFMSCGGMWSDRPRGYVDVQIERQIAAGHLPDAAARFARALAFGGVTEREAIEIIKDRDCGHLGVAHELIDPSELPDRWFRDAWRRSHNGGPIRVDMPAARRIQFSKIRAAAEAKDAADCFDIDAYSKRQSMDWGRIESDIRRADDADALRRIWPTELRGASV